MGFFDHECDSDRAVQHPPFRDSSAVTAYMHSSECNTTAYENEKWKKQLKAFTSNGIFHNPNLRSSIDPKQVRVQLFSSGSNKPHFQLMQCMSTAGFLKFRYGAVSCSSNYDRKSTYFDNSLAHLPANC
jgi:hypothetical protein